jgi:hypothetical protein
MKRFEKKEDLDEINFARKCAGLPPLKCKNKRCSKCSILFVTTSHNICCDNCRRSNQYHYDYLGEFGDKNNHV